MTARRRTPVERRWTRLYMDVVEESLQNRSGQGGGNRGHGLRQVMRSMALEDAWSNSRRGRQGSESGAARRAIGPAGVPDLVDEVANERPTRSRGAWNNGAMKRCGRSTTSWSVRGRNWRSSRMFERPRARGCLEDAQAAWCRRSSPEKARHEARCQAATRNCKEVQRRSDLR